MKEQKDGSSLITVTVSSKDKKKPKVTHEIHATSYVEESGIGSWKISVFENKTTKQKYRYAQDLTSGGQAHKQVLNNGSWVSA